MALLPEIHVNVGELTTERIYQFFLPLIPGWVLLGGLVLAHPVGVHSLAATLGLGRYSRVVVFLTSVYVAGLVLYVFSAAIVALCSILLGWAVYKWWTPVRQNQNDAKNRMWRRVAAEFLGPLAPLPAAAHLSGIDENHVEWQDFYNVLQDYVLRGTPVLPRDFLLVFTYLNATGWALLYLYLRTPIRGHWSVLLVSIVVIFFSATYPFAMNFFYWKFDRLSAWDFTARLINELKLREKLTATPQQKV